MRARFTFALVLALLGQAALAQSEYLQTFVWRMDDDTFGGLSSMKLNSNGLVFTTLSDRGQGFEGSFVRDENGKISAVSVTNSARLKGVRDKYLNHFRSDVEGITAAPKGGFYASFEGWHRVWYYRKLTAKPVQLSRHSDFRDLQPNSSLEALASDAMGTIYTIPERSGKTDRPFPVYRFKVGKWDIPFSVPRRGRFLIAGADIGPDGRLYVLERDFWVLGGFSSRVRRFEIKGDTLENETEVMRSFAGKHDNLEGISVWRDATGLRMTLVSDDNFSRLQRTEIVEYRLPLEL